MSENLKKRNEEIEVLRAAAVTFVLFHHYQGLILGHAGFYPYVEGLWSGVDLFFCISGFVIARGLLPVLAEATGPMFWREVGAFWIKRWYRIIPAAWLWIVALILVIGPQGLKGNSTFWYDAIAAVLQYSNFHFYRCSVDAARHCSALQAYWSLSVEEQFYLVIPFAAFLFRKRLWIFVLAVALGQMLLERHHFSGAGFFRTDAIALGVLLAIFSRHASYQALEPTWLRPRIGRIVPLLLIAAIGVVAHKRPFPLYMGLIALLSAATVWLASFREGYVIRAGMLRQLLVKVGERSFSIYLGQLVCYDVAHAMLRLVFPGEPADVTTRPLLTFIVGMVTLVALVEASYRWIEIPFRRRGHVVAERFRTRKPHATAVNVPPATN
jgi:peptidoglycan/LPS O-acetylase OafA/YrhL